MRGSRFIEEALVIFKILKKSSLCLLFFLKSLFFEWVTCTWYSKLSFLGQYLQVLM